MGVPDLSLPPVTLIFPSVNPIAEASKVSPIFKPNSGCAALSLSSFEMLFPFESEITSLN
jgi:hypothetical protein